MLDYDETVCRQVVFGSPDLTKWFTHYKTPEDKFGKLSLKKVFINVILPTYEYSELYKQALFAHTWIPDKELVQLLHDQIVKYGWRDFFMALRTLLRRYIRVTSDEMNKTRLFKSVDKLSDVPKTVVVPRNFRL